MPDVDKRLTRRPKFLTLICLISLAYSGLLIIIFLSGIILSYGYGNILTTYARLYDLPGSKVVSVSLTGFFLYGVSFWGVLKIYRLQRWGLYIYLIAGALLVTAQLIQGIANWYFISVYGFFSLVFVSFYKSLSSSRKTDVGIRNTE